MGLLQIRLSEKTIEEARKIGKKLFGNSTTDDKTFWTLVLEYQKSAAEKELAQNKMKLCILEKEQLSRELDEYRKQEDSNYDLGKRKHL